MEKTAEEAWHTRIQLETDSFDPLRIGRVRHSLSGHPLLQLPRLVELARYLGAKGAVRYHSDAAAAGTDFMQAPNALPVSGTPEEIVRNIETGGAWMALHNIQMDTEYKELIDEVLDGVELQIAARDPGMYQRAGWVFVASPGAVTPFHMDHENNFILQLRGDKQVSVFDPLDSEVLGQELLEAFHHSGTREQVRYKPELQDRAVSIEAKPGVGAYMPSTAGHWVKNGDGISITISFTYLTKATRLRKSVHVCNHYLRKLGVSPAPLGKFGWRDLMKASLVDVARVATRSLRS